MINDLWVRYRRANRDSNEDQLANTLMCWGKFKHLYINNCALLATSGYLRNHIDRIFCYKTELAVEFLKIFEGSIHDNPDPIILALAGQQIVLTIN